MRVVTAVVVPPARTAEIEQIGALLARLRQARQLRQSEAALRSGLSRDTVYRIENGHPGVAIGQLLRYLEAIAPGVSLKDLLTERDPSLKALAQRERTRRVRGLTKAIRDRLNF